MGKRYFYGFQPGEAERRLEIVCPVAEASLPVIHELRDVISVKSVAGLHDREGRRIDEAAVRTVSADAPPPLREKMLKGDPLEIAVPPAKQLDVIEEPVLFGGYLMNHYGHFIIESMSRLWARDRFPDLPIVFTRQGKWRNTPGYGDDVIDALNLRDRIRLIDKPTMLRQAICPGTAFEYRWRAFAVADEPHLSVAKNLKTRSRRVWSRPAYLTRSGLPDNLRKSGTEPALEAELAQRGFDIVRPEELSLAEQIELFEQAPLIVGTVGSAMHTALFSRSSGALAVLNWGRGFEHCMLVDSVKAHSSYYMKSMERAAGGTAYEINVARTLELLEEADLIAPRHMVTGISKAAARSSGEVSVKAGF